MEHRIIMIDSVLLQKNDFASYIVNFNNVTSASYNFHSNKLIKTIIYICPSIKFKLYTVLNDENTTDLQKFMDAFESAVCSSFSSIICMSLFFKINGEYLSDFHNNFLNKISKYAVNNNKKIILSLPNRGLLNEKDLNRFGGIIFTKINKNIQCASHEHYYVYESSNVVLVNVTNILVYSVDFGYYFWGGNSLANAFFAGLYVGGNCLSKYIDEDHTHFESNQFYEFEKEYNESFSIFLDEKGNADLCFFLKNEINIRLQVFVHNVERMFDFYIADYTFFLTDFYNAKKLYMKIVREVKNV